MSVWYDLKIKVLGDNVSIGRFLNLDPKQDVYTDTFSFGGKSGPSLNLIKLVEQNPDLIFLVNMSIECSTFQWWIERFNKTLNKHQKIFIQDSGSWNNEINKKVLEEYTKEYPSLPDKHFKQQKGYEDFRWTMFFNNFDKASEMLNKVDQYKIMVIPVIDNELDNDFSHLEDI